LRQLKESNKIELTSDTGLGFLYNTNES